MKTIFLANGAELSPYEPFELEGIAYAANWLSLASAEELAERNIEKREVEEEVIPGNPAPPPDAPPTACTPRQARLALLKAGLLDQVQATVDTAGGATKITWEFATLIERNSPLIETLGGSLGLTPNQIDVLFKYAVTL